MTSKRSLTIEVARKVLVWAMTLVIVVVAADTVLVNFRSVARDLISWPRRHAEEWVEDQFVVGVGRALHRVEARLRD